MLLPGATGGMTANSPQNGLARMGQPRFGPSRLAVTLIIFLVVMADLHPSRSLAQQQTDAQSLAEQAIHRLDLQTELRREDQPETPPFRLNLPPETV